MYVIGTAGHVDHGKSTLVRALTGIDPDRLREERERQMTIDLGFAWMTLPSGREVSIVDVPGHEDFIKNMLAGVGGIDVALFVVAADEAVMPQTREHLAILDLLQVPRGVVALTKSDLVTDPDWLELVQEEVREELAGTVLAQAKIVPVSALTGAGLDDLKRELDRVLDTAEPKRDLGKPRLPIDRVFTITGFGTVVTGTLIDGKLKVGDEVEITPGGYKARIRNLQSHKAKVAVAEPGSRVAANLVGVDTDQLVRGQVAARVGFLQPTMLLDARLRLLKNAKALSHNRRVEFYTGAAHSGANVRLLDVDELAPGGEAWVQMRLDEPMAVLRGDRYVIRLASPSVTLGGGVIVQSHPGRRYRRFNAAVLDHLDALLRGTPEDMLLQVLGREQPLEARELLKRANLPAELGPTTLWNLIQEGQIIALSETGGVPALVTGNVGVLTVAGWEEMAETLRQTLSAFHQRNPLRAGMPREEGKSRLRSGAGLYNQVIEYAVRVGLVAAGAGIIRLAEWHPTLSAGDERAVQRVLAEFTEAPYAPPPFQQVEAELGADLMQYVLESGRLVKVSDTVVFSAEAYAEMERRVVQYLRDKGSITVAEVRDLLGTSRKYAVGLLENLDSRRVTKRLGDVRVLH